MTIPATTLALAGVTAMDTSCTFLLVTAAWPDTDGRYDAVIVAPPGAMTFATPSEPSVLVIVTDGEDDIQCTSRLTSCVVPSLNTPVAVRVWEPLTGNVTAGGATLISTKVASVSVLGKSAWIPAKDAVISPPTTESGAATSP